MRHHRWLIPLAATLALAPLVFSGPSCGKDSIFHFQSWLDAAAQFRQGTLYPRWNFLSAYNAGEPRYIFYPPISWMLGGLLTLVLPFSWVPAALAWIALTLAGFSMRRLVCPYVCESAANIAACVYLANPFLLFSLLARFAYGELFAAAFCPLLVAAALTDCPTLWSLAWPLALMWLSNVPGGIIGTYLLLALAIIRILREKKHRLRLTLFFNGGLLAAFALAAVYLLPATVEKKFIHLKAAFEPGMRVVDNLFLHRTLDPTRDAFLIQVAHLALGLAVIAALLLALAWHRAKHIRRQPPPWRTAGIPIAIIATLVCFLLTWFATPLWNNLPNLWLVQFPWRLLFVLALCGCFALALFLDSFHLRRWTGIELAALLALVLAIPATLAYRFHCSELDAANGIRDRLLRHHTFEPIDEYVVAPADPDFMRPDNPPFWLTTDPAAYAPGTTPNPAATDPNAQMPGVPAAAQLSATPLRFAVKAPEPGYVVVNLQDYPNWQVTRNGQPAPQRAARPDGLLTLPVDEGINVFDIAWHHSWDEITGALITLAALLAGLSCERHRRSGIKKPTPPKPRHPERSAA